MRVKYSNKHVCTYESSTVLLLLHSKFRLFWVASLLSNLPKAATQNCRIQPQTKQKLSYFLDIHMHWGTTCVYRNEGYEYFICHIPGINAATESQTFWNTVRIGRVSETVRSTWNRTEYIWWKTVMLNHSYIHLSRRASGITVNLKIFVKHRVHLSGLVWWSCLGQQHITTEYSLKFKEEWTHLIS